MARAGYSGTPLAKKLGLRPGLRVWFLDMPGEVQAAISESVPDLELVDLPRPPLDYAHIFVTRAASLDCQLRMLLPLIARNGAIWVSWPKKGAGVPTDIVEDIVRQLAHPLHLVDVKVCAVDETWSGLKLVIRTADR